MGKIIRALRRAIQASGILREKKNIARSRDPSGPRIWKFYFLVGTFLFPLFFHFFESGFWHGSSANVKSINSSYLYTNWMSKLTSVLPKPFLFYVHEGGSQYFSFFWWRGKTHQLGKRFYKDSFSFFPPMECHLTSNFTSFSLRLHLLCLLHVQVSSSYLQDVFSVTPPIAICRWMNVDQMIAGAAVHHFIHFRTVYTACEFPLSSHAAVTHAQRCEKTVWKFFIVYLLPSHKRWALISASVVISDFNLNIFGTFRARLHTC